MAVFCNSLISCFPVMLLTYFLNDFEIVPAAPIIIIIVIKIGKISNGFLRMEVVCFFETISIYYTPQILLHPSQKKRAVAF